MNAEEAREIATKENQLDNYLTAISVSAKAGRFKVTTINMLDMNTKNQLAKLGYTVDTYFDNNIATKTIISW